MKNAGSLRGYAAVLTFTLAVLVAAGCAFRSAAAGRHTIGKERYIAYLEAPERAAWQKPDEVVSSLGLRAGDRVADIGTGSGYFARRLAKAVGGSGQVDALDVDEALLAYLRITLEDGKITNVHPRRVEADDPALPAHGENVIFLCNTYHQLHERPAYLAKLAASLDPSGRIVVVDFQAREDVPEGPPLREKVARETVLDEFHRAGFSLDREEAFLPYQYFLVFRPTASYSFGPVVAEISKVMHSQDSAEQKQWKVAALFSDWLAQKSLEPRFLTSDPARPVTTYLLYTDPDGAFSIASLVFRARARTNVHDHQSWVVWGTYLGSERETRYRKTAVPGKDFPKLTPNWSKVFSEGEISFIAPPPGDVHDVENVTDSVSVSIHVHATDIGKQERNAYDLEKKKVRSFVQGYESAL